MPDGNGSRPVRDSIDRRGGVLAFRENPRFLPPDSLPKPESTPALRFCNPIPYRELCFFAGSRPGAFAPCTTFYRLERPGAAA